MIITIDGPSGTGKTTIAQKVASILNFNYCDTGAMYRTIALAILKYNVDITNSDSLSKFLKQKPFNINFLKNGSIAYLIDNENVESQLRSCEVSKLSSKISSNSRIRSLLNSLQIKFSHLGNCVFEGRDLGSVVFPNADFKIFLTATPEVRSQRRYQQLISKGIQITLEEVFQSLKTRDIADATRDIAPLTIPDNAFVLDTSNINITEVIDKILLFIKKGN